MILSLISLDLTSVSVRQSLQNCQDLHRNIMQAFPTGRKEAHVLFRLVRSDKNLRAYVQSTAIPDWGRTVDNGIQCLKTKDISKLVDAFHENQTLHFTLLGCPSKKVFGEGKNSKRVLLRGADKQLEWLKCQGEKYGFIILEAHIAAKEEKMAGKKTSGEFYLSGIPFEGTLQIADVEAFKKGFVDGIGPEKAYGFGMLMVSRAI